MRIYKDKLMAASTIESICRIDPLHSLSAEYFFSSYRKLSDLSSKVVVMCNVVCSTVERVRVQELSTAQTKTTLSLGAMGASQQLPLPWGKS